MSDLELKEETPGAAAPESNGRTYAEEQYHDSLHVLLMGRPGAGKSHFAATFPKPMLVFGFDPVGKEDPYLDRGIPGPVQRKESSRGNMHYFYRDIGSRKEQGRVIIRYEYWSEANPLKPEKYQAFMARTLNLEEEVSQGGWRTLVLDSATYFELAARSWSEEGINKTNKQGETTQDGRLHYMYSTHACEQYLSMRFPNLIACNTLVLCHVDDQKDFTDEGGVTLRKMAALPGKLPNRMPGGYGECWYIYKAAPRSKERLLQTDEREGNSFDCKSLKGFTDPCPAHYELLWKNRRTGT